MFREFKEYQDIANLYQNKIYQTDEQIITESFESEKFTKEEATFIEENFEFNPEKTNEVDTSLKMITNCIDSIFNEEESWNASESTEKELQEFIEQLNTKQFKKIEEYFETMPKLSHVIKVKNPKTEKESTVILEGLAAFFN